MLDVLKYARERASAAKAQAEAWDRLRQLQERCGMNKDDRIQAEAEAWSADLIVVGSHSPSMSTYLLGSNAQNIVRHANCSVLVIRPHKDEHGNYWLFPHFGS